MTPPPESLTSRVQRWLRWAEEDLTLAEHTGEDHELLPRGACMWAHQAAEKALKALVVAQGIDPPKTHSLLHLEQLVPHELTDKLATLDLVSLTRWAIEGRCPDDLDEATAEDVETALTTARAVLGLAASAAQRMLEERAQR